jgi:hypothetical protein
MIDDDYALLTNALGDYFDGWYEADVEKLRRVFHPACRLQCVINDAHDDDDMDKVYAGVRNRQSPASRGEVRHDRILSIAIPGPTWALAQVQLSIGPKLFTDFLSFLKIEGRWQIVSKVFGFESLVR